MLPKTATLVVNVGEPGHVATTSVNEVTTSTGVYGEYEIFETSFNNGSAGS